jgi:hypothetical protein
MNSDLQLLNEKLERLERSNRRIKIGLVVVSLASLPLSRLAHSKTQIKSWRQMSLLCGTLRVKSGLGLLLTSSVPVWISIGRPASRHLSWRAIDLELGAQHLMAEFLCQPIQRRRRF